jgi:hypothetical protein
VGAIAYQACSARGPPRNPRTNVPENHAKNPCFFAELLRDIDRVFAAEQPTWNVRWSRLNQYIWPQKLGQSDGAKRPGYHTLQEISRVHLFLKACHPVGVLNELPPGKAKEPEKQHLST